MCILLRVIGATDSEPMLTFVSIMVKLGLVVVLLYMFIGTLRVPLVLVTSPTVCSIVGRYVARQPVIELSAWLVVSAHRARLPALTEMKLVILVIPLVTSVTDGILVTILIPPSLKDPLSPMKQLVLRLLVITGVTIYRLVLARVLVVVSVPSRFLSMPTRVPSACRLCRLRVGPGLLLGARNGSGPLVLVLST